MKYLLSLLFIFTLMGCDSGNSASPISSSSSLTPAEITTENWFVDQQVTDVAPDKLKTNFYVIMDGSGSMGDKECAAGSTKQIVAQKALVEFSKILPPEYNLGLLAFDSDGITERLALGVSNRPQFIVAVNEVAANSGTPLKTAIKRGYANLAKQAKRQQGYGSYHLVLVTDGDPSMGEDPTSIVNFIAEKTPVTIHTLGFCIGEGHVLNTSSVDYKPASNPEELIKGLKEVITESSTFKL